ncbi:MAG: multidrug ABC transporter permease [Lactobacillaceae bacterium]|jgi:ABC-2 type transport system permease protein|nr:multidrug ABC transporter permease [Lactobacillaceae bacterium]
MTDFITLSWFHLKIFATNSYFRTIVFVTTISYVLIQYVAAYSVNGLNDKNIWLRAGIIGIWSAGTSAAGVISYQRFQGTLAYILDSIKTESVSLATLIMPAASFGLLAFPIAFISSTILGINISGISWLLVLGVILLWFSVILLDFVVAGLFVLTPNAFLYEGLLLVPVLIGSGLYDLPNKYTYIVEILSYFLPMNTPIKLILHPEQVSIINFIQMIFIAIVWLVLARFLLKLSLKRLRVTGDMEVM